MKLDDVANRVARAYAARCWWADKEELKQEAWVAILQATRTWDETRGTPLSAYAHRAAVLAVKTFLWAQSSPVKVTKDLRTVGPITRASLDEVPTQWAPPDPAYREKWWVDVGDRIRVVIKDRRHAEIIEQIFLHGERPRKVAARTGMPIISIYNITAGARSKLRDDPILRRLVLCECCV